MKRALIAALVVLGLMAACGSATDDGHGDSGHGESSDTMEHEGSVPGAPGDASDADRKVKVIASDDFRFDPASLRVSPGEVVTFVVRNKGDIDHEFVLGDEAYQDMHEEDMAEGGHGTSDTDNAVTVGPGETAELTWRFDEEGEVLYGCHEPGHYEGGMVGTIDVR